MKTEESIIGGYAPDFEIPGIDKQVYHLGSYRQQFKAIAVVFMDDKSPEVHQYIDRLNQIQAEFSPQGFTLIGIDSDYRTSSDGQDEAIADSFGTMKKFAAENKIAFPYLRDTTQDVAKSFRAKIIPTAFLLDDQAIIRYAGAIDDAPDSAEAVTENYLRNSIINLLSANAIAIDYVQPVGSPIQWRPKQ
ncbi:MAG: redoxin domain-containing protein [Pleurocapsa sp.]